MDDRYEEILTEAHAAASKAIADKYAAGDREQPFNCGFAWVTIKGTSAFARFCASRNPESGVGHAHAMTNSKRYGRKADRGRTFWKPGTWPTPPADTRSYQQDMDFHAAAARAFADVLKEHGIAAEVGTRLD